MPVSAGRKYVMSERIECAREDARVDHEALSVPWALVGDLYQPRLPLSRPIVCFLPERKVIPWSFRSAPPHSNTTYTGETGAESELIWKHEHLTV